MALVLALSTANAAAQTNDEATRKSRFPDYPLTLAEQGNFFVNLNYVERDDTTSEHIMYCFRLSSRPDAVSAIVAVADTTKETDLVCEAPALSVTLSATGYVPAPAKV